MILIFMLKSVNANKLNTSHHLLFLDSYNAKNSIFIKIIYIHCAYKYIINHLYVLIFCVLSVRFLRSYSVLNSEVMADVSWNVIRLLLSQNLIEICFKINIYVCNLLFEITCYRSIGVCLLIFLFIKHK